MNSYPVYKLEKDLESVLTNSYFPHALEVTREDKVYRIRNPLSKGKVSIERFDDQPDYMIMIYGGNVSANRDLAAIVEEMVIASGGRKVTGEELDQVLT